MKIQPLLIPCRQKYGSRGTADVQKDQWGIYCKIKHNKENETSWNFAFFFQHSGGVLLLLHESELPLEYRLTYIGFLRLILIPIFSIVKKKTKNLIHQPIVFLSDTQNIKKIIIFVIYIQITKLI